MLVLKTSLRKRGVWEGATLERVGGHGPLLQFPTFYCLWHSWELAGGFWVDSALSCCLLFTNSHVEEFVVIVAVIILN